MPAPLLPVCTLTLIGWRMAELPVSELWLRYVEIGGNLSSHALSDYLAGAAVWPAGEHNALAHAINEALWDLGHASLAPYRDIDLSLAVPAGNAGDHAGG